MSELIEDAGGPGRGPQPSAPSPATAAPVAAAGDAPAGVPAEVESVGAPAIGLPDHLQPGHGTLEEAWAAFDARQERHEDFGSLIAAHDARRASHSIRLEHWLSGGDQ